MNKLSKKKRENRINIIRDLREKGASWREVGEDLNLSHEAVRKYYHKYSGAPTIDKG